MEGRNKKPKANFSLDLRSLRHISYFANMYHNIKGAYVKVRKSQKSFFLSSIPPKFFFQFLPWPLKCGRKIKKINLLYYVKWLLISVIRCHYFFDSLNF